MCLVGEKRAKSWKKGCGEVGGGGEEGCWFNRAAVGILVHQNLRVF